MVRPGIRKTARAETALLVLQGARFCQVFVHRFALTRERDLQLFHHIFLSPGFSETTHMQSNVQKTFIPLTSFWDPSIYLSIYLYIDLSIYRSIDRKSIYLSIHLSILVPILHRTTVSELVRAARPQHASNTHPHIQSTPWAGQKPHPSMYSQFPFHKTHDDFPFLAGCGWVAS